MLKLGVEVGLGEGKKKPPSAYVLLSPFPLCEVPLAPLLFRFGGRERDERGNRQGGRKMEGEGGERERKKRPGRRIKIRTN